MKKFITLLLCTFILLTFAACGKNKSADKYFKDAYDKTSALDSYNCRFTIKNTSSITGIVTTDQAEFNTKNTDTKSKFPIIESNLTFNDVNGLHTSNMYIDDKYIYYDEGNGKTKIAVENDTAKKVPPLFGFPSNKSTIFAELPSPMLKDIKIDNGKNNSKSFEVSITEEQLKNMFKSVVNTSYILGSVTSEAETVIGIKNAKVNVTIDKNGYISEYGIRFTTEVSVPLIGSSVIRTTQTSAKLEFIAAGEKITVTPPTDLDKYVESVIPDFNDAPDPTD